MLLTIHINNYNVFRMFNFMIILSLLHAVMHVRARAALLHVDVMMCITLLYGLAGGWMSSLILWACCQNFSPCALHAFLYYPFRNPQEKSWLCPCQDVPQSGNESSKINVFAFLSFSMRLSVYQFFKPRVFECLWHQLNSNSSSVMQI